MVPIKWQFDEGTTCSNRPSGRIPKGPPVGVQPEGATCKQWRCQWQNWRFQLQKTCFFHMVNRKKYYHWIPVDIQWPATHQKKEVSWDDRPVSTARRSEGHETTLDIPRHEKMGYDVRIRNHELRCFYAFWIIGLMFFFALELHCPLSCLQSEGHMKDSLMLSNIPPMSACPSTC
jgi:hypothetical protein